LTIQAYLKTVSLEILAMAQSRNYNEEPVQRFAFISAIIATTFVTFHFSKRDWLATQSTPPLTKRSGVLILPLGVKNGFGIS